VKAEREFEEEVVDRLKRNIREEVRAETSLDTSPLSFDFVNAISWDSRPIRIERELVIEITEERSKEVVSQAEYVDTLENGIFVPYSDRYSPVFKFAKSSSDVGSLCFKFLDTDVGTDSSHDEEEESYLGEGNEERGDEEDVVIIKNGVTEVKHDEKISTSLYTDLPESFLRNACEELELAECELSTSIFSPDLRVDELERDEVKVLKKTAVFEGEIIGVKYEIDDIKNTGERRSTYTGYLIEDIFYTEFDIEVVLGQLLSEKEKEREQYLRSAIQRRRNYLRPYIEERRKKVIREDYLKRIARALYLGIKYFLPPIIVLLSFVGMYMYVYVM
jgi:hypothetical protein